MNERIIIHPGEILQEEFLAPLRLSQNQLAIAIHVPPRRINEIVHGKRAITADTALRLSKYFGMSNEFWLNLQSHYDMRITRLKLENELESIHRCELVSV